MGKDMWQEHRLSCTSVLICASIYFLSRDSSIATAARLLHQACEPADEWMNATHELFRNESVIWQIPPNPRAIIFFLHGSHHDNLMYFDRGAGCPQCFGLPEHRATVLSALKEGHAVLTVRWNAPYLRWMDWDRRIAIDLVKTWTKKHSLEHLPIVGWGHSAGGFVISRLALDISFRALVLMCSEGDVNSLQLARAEEFPPTFFAFMNNTLEDSVQNFTNIDDIAISWAILEDRGVSASGKMMLPMPVTASFLLKSIHCLTEETAHKIHGALKANGSWLDEDDYLVTDRDLYEDDSWKMAILEQHEDLYCKEIGDLCLEEHVDSVLKVARGVHAFTRHANPEIFPWLNSAISSSHGRLSNLLPKEE